MTVDRNNPDESIDLLDLFALMLKEKFLVLVFTITGALLSLSYSLYLPDKYTSSTLLYIKEDSPQTPEQFGALANYVGLGSTTGQVNKASFGREIIFSHFFIRKLYAEDLLVASLVAAESYSEDTQTITFNKKFYDSDRKNWVISDNQTSSKPTYSEFYKTYNDSINFDIDDDGFIEIAFTHISPLFAKEMLEKITNEANSWAKEKALLEATQSLEFLKKELLSSSISSIKQKINDLISQELSKKMKANVSIDYLFSTLDGPIIQEKKSGPNRALICIIVTLSFFLLSLIYIFLKHSRVNNI